MGKLTQKNQKGGKDATVFEVAQDWTESGKKNVEV